MRPALSVIFFTTLSGMGYGLLCWLGLRYAWRPLPLSAEYALILFWLALGLVTLGLLASVLHLGRPLRAWRAFSQWRTSWLSREGVLALATYVPAGLLAWSVAQGEFGALAQFAAAALALLSLATVAATAMIYACLRPIPAWRHWAVLPVYLGFALAGGGAWLLSLLSLTGWRPGAGLLGAALALLAVLLLLKLFYWRDLRRPLSADRAAAVGLPASARVRPFEAPHTEASFVTREMVFSLARRYALALRIAAVVLFAALPAAVLARALAGSMPATGTWLLATGALWLGSFLERWLFFAEARHVVTLYY